MTFFPIYYAFQDQDLGNMIGVTKERNGLYYLETTSKSFVSFLSKHHLLNKEKFWFHHRSLGYPSFQTLKFLFLSLFSKLDIESFHCDACELVKHKRSPFLIKIKEVQNLFI
ncbi:hypothetical protein VitviT2T_002127 [Vitis vinifera]|uniref:GAG-pre-integrase domain-containing protein n=1 Tax=Vitis vinifera TaxID=29760 RepID=A0ABY9BIZ9_VITVI|nr:hypothetical protein VitviT2T_002127 [Vitis vinifera]